MSFDHGATAGHGDDALFRALLGRRPDALLITGSSLSAECLQDADRGAHPVVEIWDVSSRPIDMAIGLITAQVGAEVAGYFRPRVMSGLPF